MGISIRFERPNASSYVGIPRHSGLGIQGRVVMEILGHSQIGVTMDIYSHVIPELQQDAAAKASAWSNR